MIIGISGGINEGKDTVAEMFIEQNPSYVNKKFAGKLKEVVALLTGCRKEQLEVESFKDSLVPESLKINGERVTYRFMLQYVGTEVFREKMGSDIWVNSLFSDYKKDDNYLITDVRFKSEFDSIKERGGINVLLERSQTIDDWLKHFEEYGISSKYKSNQPIDNWIEYFKECGVIPCNHISKYKISKQKFVDLAYNNFEIKERDKFAQKFLHRSERELYEMFTKEEISFDYIIENNDGLESLQKEVKKFSKYFFNQTK